MTTVHNILQYIETLAPRHMKMDWDNVGLLCGRPGKEVHKVLVALDPFRNVIQEAIEGEAQLIVTHHPLIFGSITSVNEDTETGRCLLALIENGIAAINAHTNLDQAPGGVNDRLAASLGLRNIQVISPEGTDEAGAPWGLLRKGEVEEQSLTAFLSSVKQALGCEGLRYVEGGKPVCKVAVGGGSCAGGMEEAARAGCDTFVTADVKYNQFWDARNLGLNLIDAGHFYTENPVTDCLAQALSARFPELEIVVSSHRDCTKFF